MTWKFCFSRADTVKAVAEQVSKPAGANDVPGPFISLRRFAYSDANNFSYVLFTGDSSTLDADGKISVHDVRKTVQAGASLPYNRNQRYWTGTEWKTCALQRQVVTTKLGTATTPQTSTYCGGSRSESKVASEDIAGKTLREVVTKIRAYPLADSVGADTHPISGLPVNWGPAPGLLPADAVFPAGSKMSSRSIRNDIGGVDRIELTNKSAVRWSDGVYRQATQLEQFSGMPGNLADAAVVPGNGNTVFVADVNLAEQADATLEKYKRWRAGLDVAGLKIRFYQCDLRKSDQAALNCAASGDGSLAIATQGGVRLMRVANGYPAVLSTRLGQERFWAETGGNVFRGARDLERTRYDQRVNKVAWDTLRTALAIPAHIEPVAPVPSGPFVQLRGFSFSNIDHYSLRLFTGDAQREPATGQHPLPRRRHDGVPRQPAQVHGRRHRHGGHRPGAGGAQRHLGRGVRQLGLGQRAGPDDRDVPGQPAERHGDQRQHHAVRRVLHRQAQRCGPHRPGGDPGGLRRQWQQGPVHAEQQARQQRLQHPLQHPA